MLTSTQDSKPSSKAKKDKKEKQYKAKQNSTNPATKIKKVEVSDHRKRKKDINKIMYYNCNKRRYYLDKGPKSQKLKN